MFGLRKYPVAELGDEQGAGRVLAHQLFFLGKRPVPGALSLPSHIQPTRKIHQVNVPAVLRLPSSSAISSSLLLSSLELSD